MVHVDLEYRLRAGEPARVEEYLARYPELTDDRAVVLDLIAAELGLRRRREPGLALDEFFLRFPDYRAELPGQVHRTTIDGLDTMPHPMDGLRRACPRSPAMRSWGCSVAAAWASCTRPGNLASIGPWR